ncbi:MULTISPECIES: acyltransferase family protein [unclassified Gordonia (in: high G+C Gram-positive bacteria)]|uniref:acyltransferase family protein n=1 Tax=unclassified Gordonia (in: high G+C Gram-positive bacteria) TaxID=2657482 RepID=UPI0009ECC08F|nr:MULTISPECIES: acyltransferase [unclassified Gordonia (in: high G+C Gram-positive bacteria)]
MTSTDPGPTSPATAEPATGSARRFYPQLEGMRAIAAIGVLVTHVAFQTRAVEIPVLGPVLGRLDLAVALFFALSGFLLWRPWVDAAHRGTGHPSVPRYFRHRVVRIWPAYVVVVTLVILLLPEAQGADAQVWLANLTLTQVFVPLTLTAGLTQMWSLSVEIAFYALLPLIGFALLRLRAGRLGARIPTLVVLAALSLGWAWVGTSLPVADGVETKNWVFGHLPWFVAGLVLAEIAGVLDSAAGASRPGRWMARVIRVSANRPLMFGVLVVAYALACTRLAGPTGLGDVTEIEFATKMVLGALCGYALLAPLVCNDGPFRILTSRVMLALGRWSYGIFIWHVAILAVVFPLFGIVPFSGNTLLVLVITLGLSIGVAAASYAFIEEPTRNWLRTRESRRRNRVRQVPPDASSTSSTSSSPLSSDDGPSSTAEKNTSHAVIDTATSAGS